MLTIEEIRLLVEDRNIKAVAAKAGVEYITAWRICRGDPGNVSYAAVKKLSDYLTKSTQ